MAVHIQRLRRDTLDMVTAAAARSVQDLLDDGWQPQLLAGDDQYQCVACDGKCDGTKQVF